jgi:hypothetical protein
MNVPANANAKMAITPDVLSSQAALELPDRHLLGLVTIVITNVLNNLSVDVDVRNNNVAVQVCAVVEALNTSIGTDLTCDIQQH